MKILFMTIGTDDINNLPNSCKAEYLSDLLFHGLRELIGEDCVDFPAKMHLYRGFPNKDQLWGRGFSYTDTLDNIPVDRNGIYNKISKNYFDVIVVGAHNSADHYPNIFLSALNRIYESGTKSKIVVLDGKDRSDIFETALQYTPYYFKREINSDRKDLIPIHFAIPECKIAIDLPNKIKGLASIVPSDHSHPNRHTHVYTKEEDYYKDYQDSYFAITCKKAGWDCMRHYEIIGNGCIPIFSDIELCPDQTLTNLPKKWFSSIKEIKGLNLPSYIFDKNAINPNHHYVDMNKIDEEFCLNTAALILEYARRELTTKSLAKYFLEKIND